MNGIFLPMFIQGLAGVNRRLYDGGRSYAHGAAIAPLYSFQWWFAVLLGLSQLFFMVNVVVSLVRGARAEANPWKATTLEWLTSSPPPHHNFDVPPRVLRGAYEYSVPGRDEDFLTQADRHQPMRSPEGIEV
jgi:cytochrome c oxidase subunit 1